MSHAPAAPAPSERVSWLLVVIWSLVIFATIPVARALERTVEESVGEQAFLWAVGVAIAAASPGRCATCSGWGACR